MALSFISAYSAERNYTVWADLTSKLAGVDVLLSNRLTGCLLPPPPPCPHLFRPAPRRILTLSVSASSFTAVSRTTWAGTRVRASTTLLPCCARWLWCANRCVTWSSDRSHILSRAARRALATPLLWLRPRSVLLRSSRITHRCLPTCARPSTPRCCAPRARVSGSLAQDSTEDDALPPPFLQTRPCSSSSLPCIAPPTARRRSRACWAVWGLPATPTSCRWVENPRGHSLSF